MECHLLTHYKEGWIGSLKSARPYKQAETRPYGTSPITVHPIGDSSRLDRGLWLERCVVLHLREHCLGLGQGATR